MFVIAIATCPIVYRYLTEPYVQLVSIVVLLHPIISSVHILRR